MSDIETRLESDIAAMNPDYVELAAAAIYEAVNNPLAAFDIICITQWQDLGEQFKGVYHNAAIAVIKAMLAAFYREEEAMSAQEAEARASADIHPKRDTGVDQRLIYNPWKHIKEPDNDNGQ